METVKQDNKRVAKAFLSQLTRYAKGVTLKGVHNIEVERNDELVTIVIKSPSTKPIFSEYPFSMCEMQKAARELRAHMERFLADLPSCPSAKEGNLLGERA